MVCQTSSFNFDSTEGKVKRGVISYYATKTLPDASSVESWRQLMSDAMAEDAKNGRLSNFHQKQLQVLGDGKALFPKTETVNK